MTYILTCDKCKNYYDEGNTDTTPEAFVERAKHAGWMIRPVPGLEGEDMYTVLCPTCTFWATTPHGYGKIVENTPTGRTECGLEYADECTIITREQLKELQEGKIFASKERTPSGDIVHYLRLAEDTEAGESTAEYALEIFFGLLIIYLLLSLLGIDLIHYLRVVLEFIGGGK